MSEFDEKLAHIRELLAEAYTKALAEDGHCKSSEGAISVHYPPFFWSFGADDEPSVSIYSYVLGPHRDHYFANVNEALVAVTEWHADEMGRSE